MKKFDKSINLFVYPDDDDTEANTAKAIYKATKVLPYYLRPKRQDNFEFYFEVFMDGYAIKSDDEAKYRELLPGYNFVFQFNGDYIIDPLRGSTLLFDGEIYTGYTNSNQVVIRATIGRDEYEYQFEMPAGITESVYIGDIIQRIEELISEQIYATLPEFDTIF